MGFCFVRSPSGSISSDPESVAPAAQRRAVVMGLAVCHRRTALTLHLGGAAVHVRHWMGVYGDSIGDYRGCAASHGNGMASGDRPDTYSAHDWRAVFVDSESNLLSHVVGGVWGCACHPFALVDCDGPRLSAAAALAGTFRRTSPYDTSR